MTDIEASFNFEERETIEADFIINAQTTVATWGSITGLLSNQTDLQSALNNKANITTTINGYPLSSNITLKTSDLTNDSSYITLSSLSSTATGLSYDNTNGVFSLTSGYTIPLSATLATYITKDANNLTYYRTSANQDIIDTQLQTNITTEATTRANADTQLSTRITTEATTRANADETLQDNIDDEVNARSDADTLLSNRITTNTNNISTEISNRQSADTTLQNNIDAEATTRATSDTALSDRITTNTNNLTSEVNTRTNITNALRSDLDDEVSARTSGDTGLQNSINSVSSNLTTHVNRTDNPHSVSKTQVGLGNVDNTSDLSKPISTATQNALNNKANVSTVNSLTSRVTNIENVIPDEATSSNQLADKDYVDDSIGTGNLTIQKNGTGVVVFNANSTTNQTANLIIPTKTSDLTNDANFIDLTDLSSGSASLTYNNANGQISVTNGYSITTNIEKNQIGINADDIDDIQELIPTQASSSNQLADKDFVNSTIQTGSANFRGNWDDWTSVPIYASEYPLDYQGNRTPHVNDYMVVQDTSDYAPLYSNTRTYALNFIVYYNSQLYKCIEAIDEPEEFTASKWTAVTVGSYSGCWRFKYNGTWSSIAREGWQPEYKVNDEPFTEAQLKAINSGITDTKVAQITTNQNNITTINSTISGYGNIVTHNTSEFATASQGALADSALQPNDNISELTNDENYIKLTSLSTDATGLTYDNTNGKLSLTNNYQIPTTSQVSQIATNKSNIETLQAVKYGKGIDFSNSTLTLEDQDGNTLDTTTIEITSSLEDLTDVSLSSLVNNQALVYDSNTAKWVNKTQKISDLTDDTATNPIDKADTLTGLTATVSELNYTDGVTSNIQTQLNGKQATLSEGTLISLSNNTVSFTGTIPTKISDLTDDTSNNPIDKADTLTGLTATITELNYTDGVTSNIQTQLNNKLSNTTKYGADLSYSNSSLQLKDQDGNALGSAVTIESSPAIDDITITKNSNDELQTVGVIDNRDSSTAIKTWTGTKSQYNNIGTYYAYTYSTTTLYVRTDAPTTSSTVYSAIGTTSAFTITAVGTNYTTLTLSDGNTYDRDSEEDTIDSTQYSNSTLYNITDDTDITLSLLQTIYPVGSIYITTNSTCPLSTLFGTWTLVGADRVLQGAGTRGSVGTTVEESLPNITGTIATSRQTYDGSTHEGTGAFTASYPNGSSNGTYYGTDASYYVKYTLSASNSSSTYQTDAPVQPDAYLVNIYRRTA